MIESRRMRWERHVIHMGEVRLHTTFLSENVKGRDHVDRLDKDGRVILEQMLDK
jgi:hypothetical protein